MFKRIIAGALLFITVPIFAAALTLEQQMTKERGITLYNQYRDGSPALRIAAEAGDAEAQYYLAEDIRHEHQYITKEAFKWYVAAARQGDLYAMIRLGRSGSDLCNVMQNCAEENAPIEWLRAAIKKAKPLAEKGDGEAMYILYEISGEWDWLEKAAEAGFAFAQYKLAIFIDQGEGLYLWPGSREETAKKWMEASAESGYPKAMIAYAVILNNKGNSKQASKVLYKRGS